MVNTSLILPSRSVIWTLSVSTCTRTCWDSLFGSCCCFNNSSRSRFLSWKYRKVKIWGRIIYEGSIGRGHKVWKFLDFPNTEINFEDSRISKIAIFAIFWTLNLVHLVISAFQKCKNSLKSKFRASCCVWKADFALLEYPKLVSRKICVIEKSWNFHSVCFWLGKIS